MQMTTTKLILLRGYNSIIGRFSWGQKILRKILEKVLITGNQDTYTPCSKYFNINFFKNGK